MSSLTQYDAWLTDDGPAALVIREHLVPVEGPDGVLFPASFAPEEGGRPRQDEVPGRVQHRPRARTARTSAWSTASARRPTGSSRCSPRRSTSGLVPQMVVTAGEKSINLLEAGHRAGDAVVRCTGAPDRLARGVQGARRPGMRSPLAKIAPTSLVFGVWDSRNTQAKLPRLVASTIRAYDVRKLTRSAQYNPAAEYEKDDLLPPPAELKLTEKKYGERGFSHVPAPATHGGVIASGGIRRDATLSLAALRLLAAGTDEAKTDALRRYILGLSLVALTATASTYLRQGCNLVPDIDKPREFTLVHGDGQRETGWRHPRDRACVRTGSSEGIRGW